MSWYPKPEETISFSKIPIMEPLPVVKKSLAYCALLRGWASPSGAAVRQPTVYQETTMAKHGTQHFSLAHGPSLEKLLVSAIDRLLY